MTIVVFDHAFDAAVCARIDAAVKAVDPDAYCVSGYTEPSWQAAYVAIDEKNIHNSAAEKIRRAAIVASDNEIRWRELRSAMKRLYGTGVKRDAYSALLREVEEAFASPVMVPISEAYISRALSNLAKKG